MRESICNVLRDLVPFVQFKKRETHPCRSVNFINVADQQPATLLTVTLLHGFFHFFKLYKWYQIAQRITYVDWQSREQKS